MVLWLTIVCLTKKNSKQLKKHKNEYIWSYIHVDGCGLSYIAPVTLYVSSSISLPLYLNRTENVIRIIQFLS